MMEYQDAPQLPLTARRKLLVAIGAAMFLLQVGAAIALAPAITGEDDANAPVLFATWAASMPWSAVAALLLVRQADLPDVATASFIVTIAAFAAFAFTTAYDARGTSAAVNLTDAIFLGVTSGGLTALIVWGIAMGAARVLHLPTSEAIRAED